MKCVNDNIDFKNKKIIITMMLNFLKNIKQDDIKKHLTKKVERNYYNDDETNCFEYNFKIDNISFKLKQKQGLIYYINCIISDKNIIFDFDFINTIFDFKFMFYIIRNIYLYHRYINKIQKNNENEYKKRYNKELTQLLPKSIIRNNKLKNI